MGEEAIQLGVKNQRIVMVDMKPLIIYFSGVITS